MNGIKVNRLTYFSMKIKCDKIKGEKTNKQKKFGHVISSQVATIRAGNAM
jgi:hypothetical protein